MRPSRSPRSPLGDYVLHEVRRFPPRPADLGCLRWVHGLAYGKPRVPATVLVVLAGVVVHSAYWLGLSLGWPRYLFIGVILLSALLTFPYLTLQRPVPILLYSGALTLSLLGTVGRLQMPISELGGTWFAPSAIRTSQEGVVMIPRCAAGPTAVRGSMVGVGD